MGIAQYSKLCFLKSPFFELNLVLCTWNDDLVDYLIDLKVQAFGTILGVFALSQVEDLKETNSIKRLMHSYYR